MWVRVRVEGRGSAAHPAAQMAQPVAATPPSECQSRRVATWLGLGFAFSVKG